MALLTKFYLEKFQWKMFLSFQIIGIKFSICTGWHCDHSFDLYGISKQKWNRKFVNYRKIRVNTHSNINSNKELLLESWILLTKNSHLPHIIRFFKTFISYSLNIQGSSCTWIWILLAKSVYSDCPYALDVTVSPFQIQKEKNITVSQ